MEDLTRRQVARTAAWSVPVLAIAAAAPAAMASTTGQTCPGVFAGPAPSWLTSDGFNSYGDWRGEAAWYVTVALNFQSEQCGFGSNYAVTTDVSSVVAHTRRGGTTGTLSPLSYVGLDSFADRGQCADTLTMAMGGVGADDLYVTSVSFVYLVSGLPGQAPSPCSVPVTATLTYAGGSGNDASGSVVIS